MLSELLQKLESEHGIAPSQGQGVLNTITQHIKEQFPMIGGMLDKAFGGGSAGTSATPTTSNVQGGTGQESSLQQLEDVVKSKLGGLF